MPLRVHVCVATGMSSLSRIQTQAMAMQFNSNASTNAGVRDRSVMRLLYDSCSDIGRSGACYDHGYQRAGVVRRAVISVARSQGV